LNKAVAVLPTARQVFGALLRDHGHHLQTLGVYGHFGIHCSGLIRVILPLSWLRAEKRTPSQFVTTITDGALTVAITVLPAFRPRLTALP
jgi:hypothetical protein